MRLSAFTIVDSTPGDATLASRDRYQEVLRLGEAADQAGLHALWLAEHHFQPGGTCPSPAVLLGALAARTRRLRLGVMVSVLPFHDPVLLAEEYAMVDRLSGGRLNLGLGSGYIQGELDAFAVSAEDKRPRFDRSYEVLLRALRGEPVSTLASGATSVRLNVRPVQQPHPPIWIAVQRREAIPHVAKRGASIGLIPYATVTGLDQLAEEIREFRAHTPEGSQASVSVALHLYAGQDPELARAALQRYLDSRLATQSTFYQAKVRADPKHASAGSIEASGFAVFGDAPSVRRRLAAFEALGVDEVLGIFDFGGLSAEEAVGSVERLGAEFRR